MKKKIIFILLAFIMLGTIAYFYVNRIMLPGHIKTQIEAKISEFTQRTATIERIRFKLSKGVSLENILIKEKDGNKTFLKIDEVHFNVLLAPILKNKTIVIPTVTITKPVTQIIQFEDGSLNYSQIFSPKKNKTTAQKYRIFITKIKVNDGSIDYLKKTPLQDFSESLRNVDVDIALSLDKQINYQISGTLPQEESALKIQGVHTLGKKDITAEFQTTNLNIIKYLRLLNLQEKISVKTGRLANADLKIDYNKQKIKISGDALFTNIFSEFQGNRSLKGNIRFLNASLLLEQESIKAEGEIRIPSSRLQLAPDQIFEGDIQSTIQSLSYKEKELVIKGNLKANNVAIILDGIRKFRSHITSRETTLTINQGKVAVFGDFDLTESTLNFSDTNRFNGNLFAKNFSLNQKDNILSIKSNFVSDNGRLEIDGQKLINTQISTDNFTFKKYDDTVLISSLIKLDNAVVSLNNGSKFQGSPHLDIEYTYPLKKDIPQKLNGKLILENGLIVGLPYIDSASNINGEIIITENSLLTKSLKFNAENTNITLSGQLNNFKDMAINFEATTESVELHRLKKFFPDIFQKHGITLDGRSAVELSFSGPVKSSEQHNISIHADLKDAHIITAKIPEGINQINGSLIYEKDIITWKKLSGIYKDLPFSAAGQLTDFSRPVITTSLSCRDLKVKTEINLFNNTIRFPSIEASYLNSDFSGSADIYFYEDFEPDIQINGQSVIYLSDLPAILPKYKETLEQYALEGIIDTHLFFKGKAKDWEDWSLSLDGKTDSLIVKGHPLKDVKITYLQRDKNISKLNMSSSLYNGKVNFSSSANIENKQFPFDLTFNLYDINLAEFAKTQKLRKNSKLAGNFTANLLLSGEALNQNTWKGEGNYNIKDGYIWQLKIIEGLSSIMLIPEFTNTVYTASRANFTVQDRKISTNNLILESQTMTINTKGWIDFDRRINFAVSPTLSEIAMIQSESVKKWSTAFLSQGINLVKVTGTLENPKYHAEAAPLKILKDTTSVITEGVGGILQGIFK